MMNRTDAIFREKPGLLSYENSLLLILCLTFGMLFWNRLAVNFLLPFIAADLHLSNTQMGLLVSLLSLTWALSSFLLGSFSDRTGIRKPLLVVLVLGFSAASLLSGMAASFIMLAISRLLMGLAQGAVLPIAQSAIAAESSPNRRGFNMGFLQNFGSGVLGNIVAPIVLIAIAGTWGWRAGFYLSALPGLLFAVLILLVMRPDARNAAGPAAGDPSVRVLDIVRCRNVAVCIAITCLMVMWLMIQMTFLPGFMVHDAGLTNAEMGVQLSLRGISGLAAGIILPTLSDRVGRKPIVIVATLLSAVAPFCTAMPGLTLTGMTLINLASGIGAGCMPLVMATIPAESVSPRQMVTAIGVTLGLGEIAGGFIAPVAAGFMADIGGPTAPYLLAGAAAIIAGILAISLRETRPQTVALA